MALETDIEAEGGKIRLIDFMPHGGAHSSLARIVAGLEGSVNMRSDLRLRFDYGLMSPWCEAEPGGCVAKVGPDLVVLRTNAPLDVSAHRQSSDFTVRAGERFPFVLSYGSSTEPVPRALDVEHALDATASFWRDWVGRFDNSKTLWPSELRRSLITLKALVTHVPAGSSPRRRRRCPRRRAER